MQHDITQTIIKLFIIVFLTRQPILFLCQIFKDQSHSIIENWYHIAGVKFSYEIVHALLSSIQFFFLNIIGNTKIINLEF